MITNIYIIIIGLALSFGLLGRALGLPVNFAIEALTLLLITKSIGNFDFRVKKSAITLALAFFILSVRFISNSYFHANTAAFFFLIAIFLVFYLSKNTGSVSLDIIKKMQNLYFITFSLLLGISYSQSTIIAADSLCFGLVGVFLVLTVEGRLKKAAILALVFSVADIAGSMTTGLAFPISILYYHSKIIPQNIKMWSYLLLMITAAMVIYVTNLDFKTFYEILSEFNDRLIVWDSIVSHLIAKNNFFGSGNLPETWVLDDQRLRVDAWVFPHNDYISIFSIAGIGGLFMYIAGWYVFLRSLKNRISIALCIYILITSLTDNSLFYPNVIIPLLALLKVTESFGYKSFIYK